MCSFIPALQPKELVDVPMVKGPSLTLHRGVDPLDCLLRGPQRGLYIAGSGLPVIWAYAYAWAESGISSTSVESPFAIATSI